MDKRNYPASRQTSIIMKLLHIDAFAGISGDMSVAALRDLGVPEEVFLEALKVLAIELPSCRFERGDRNGISGWRFLVSGHEGVEGEEGAKTAHHHHHHGSQSSSSTPATASTTSTSSTTPTSSTPPADATTSGASSTNITINISGGNNLIV